MSSRSTYPSQTAVGAAFVWAAARGLAELEPEDTTGEALILKLCLSTWLHKSGADLTSALDQLLEFRNTLVEASGLDAVSEPVPLLGGDARRAVLNVAIYLHGLIVRAAGRSGTDRRDLVEEVLSAGPGRVLALL